MRQPADPASRSSDVVPSLAGHADPHAGSAEPAAARRPALAGQPPAPTRPGTPAPAEAGPAASRPRGALTLVFFILLLDVMGMTLLFPVGAFLVRRYSADALMVTLLSAIYAGAQLLAAPILGRLSDRWGRRPILVASLFGSAAGYVLFGLGGALWVLLLSRAIDGLTGGNMSTATAYIADVSAPEERSKNFGLVGVAWGVGLVLGPALGAATGQIRLELPAYVAAGLTLAAGLLCLRFLPESLPPGRRDRGPLRLSQLNPFAAIARTFRRPEIVVPLAALGIFQLVFNGANSIDGVSFIERFAVLPWQMGLALVGVGAMVALVQSVGVRVVLPRLGERRLGTLALSLLAAGCLAVAFAPTLGLAIAAMLFRHTAAGFVFPSLGGLCSARTRPQDQGELMGVTTGIASAASVLGPVGAGLAHQHVFPGAAYWAAAALALGAAALVARLRAPQPRPEVRQPAAVAG
jgi:MFS family permease